MSELTSLFLAVGAILTGVGGVATSFAAVNRARKEAETECEHRLAELRVEVETHARSLHWWRMNHLDEREPE